MSAPIHVVLLAALSMSVPGVTSAGAASSNRAPVARPAPRNEAAAQSAKRPPKNGKKRDGTTKAKFYDFDGDNLQGDIVRPDGDDVLSMSGPGHSSLIRLRVNFVREVIKSGDDL